MLKKTLKKMEVTHGFIHVPSPKKAELLGNEVTPFHTRLNDLPARVDIYGRIWSGYLKNRFPVNTAVTIEKHGDGFRIIANEQQEYSEINDEGRIEQQLTKEKVFELTPVEDEILRVLKNSSTIGITKKQIAFTLGEKEETVTKHLDVLFTKKQVNCIGRGLWILRDYEDIGNVAEFTKSDYYTQLFKQTYPNVSFARFNHGITFAHNEDKPVHRWSPYVQGFSSTFVDAVLAKYSLPKGSIVADPYAGSGTVLVCAKSKQLDSVGVELSPLLTFMAKVKTTWEPTRINITTVRNEAERIRTLWGKLAGNVPMPFLKETNAQFNEDILHALSILKESILTVEDPNVQALFLLAFASILVASSNLKRSPCLGYTKKKMLTYDAPFKYFQEKITQMVSDLQMLQAQRSEWADVEIVTGDSRTHTYKPNSIKLAITSPPYANGLDYVTNYKLEMAWLGKASNYGDLRKLRDQMVSCDNISRAAIRQFAKEETRFEDEWLNKIVENIRLRVQKKGTFRRNDMHLVVKKYFEDLYQTFDKVYAGLDNDGHFVIVIGDSLIAGTYIPTDLILAKIGERIGFNIEDIQLARIRRSGQRRSFELRETIVTLTKGKPQKTINLDDFVNRVG